MGTGNLDRVKHVLAQALDLASDARPEFLDLACAGDVTLRAEIDSLLGQRSIDFSLLDGPIRSLFRPASGGLQGGTVAEPRPGDRVGPYRIERRLGEGGMGVVLLASREEDFRKRVAIKLVRSARMSRVVVLRFFRERQILAKLEHPNIARVLDGGLTRAGLPYFVMEYVDGLPIDEYCRRRALPIAGQVQLLIEICSALQAAHSHLVVHRDLKPSNILVTSEGVPKLLDFGIAKLLAPEADALLTDQHQRPMTLRYASPEQVCGTTLGTQSDIYSLAVVAFELLTGQMPYRLPSGGDLELARAICEQEPRRPSWALSEDRSRCRLRHPRFRRPQAADLDSIVLKALRKDPEHRYGSVEGMADDLKRFLEGRPVSARSGSRSYRAARFLSRHRWVTLSFLVFLLFAGTFAVASALLWQRAVVERARTHRVMSFMKEAIRSAGLDRAHGEVSTIEDLMRDAWRRIDELGDDPQTLTEFLETFGGLYVDLGLYPEAEEQLELVAALRREKHPDGDAALARAIGDRCGLLVRREDFRGAETCYREALDLWQALGSDPEAVAQARRDLASSLLIQGRSSEAASLLRQVVETRQRASKGRGEAMAMSLADLGTATLLEGDLAGAAPLLERAFEMSQERFGDHGTQTAVAAAALGRLRFAQGRVDEAEALFDTVYRDRLRSLGADHPDSAEVELDLATLFLDQGSTETARLLVSKALPTLKRSLGPASWRVAEAEGLLGVVLLREQRIEQAEPCLRDSLERLEGSLGPRSPFTRQARRRLAEIADRPSPIKTGHGPRRPPGGRN